MPWQRDEHHGSRFDDHNNVAALDCVDMIDLTSASEFSRPNREGKEEEGDNNRSIGCVGGGHSTANNPLPYAIRLTNTIKFGMRRKRVRGHRHGNNHRLTFRILNMFVV